MRIGRRVLQNVNIAGRVNSNSVAFPWLQPVVLFSLTLLTRVPFTSKFLYELDSVQYALGLQKYDVYLHQPQPPGYFLYVMAGRAVNVLFRIRTRASYS
jgi:hypothetical protein